MPETSLLLAAIEDNVAWCSAICAAHGSDERMTASAWINLAPSPPYYPNIITRRPGAQADIIPLIEAARKRNAPKPWGIKDSFADLDLTEMGFSPMIEGQWLGGEPAIGRQQASHDWDTVRSPEELSGWEGAWSEDDRHRIFPADLLEDPRIRFWMLRRAGEITAGCVTFASGLVTGLSNWFSRGTETAFELGIMGSIAADRPVVFWMSGNEATPAGFSPLGPMRVWTSI